MQNPVEFFKNLCDLENLEKIALGAFCRGNLGELFLEYSENESLRLEDGRVQAPTFSSSNGFGLRTFREDTARYSYSSVLTPDSMKKAVNFVQSDVQGSRNCEIKNVALPKSLYSSAHFINDLSLEKKINFLKKIDQYARAKSPLVKQVNAALVSSWKIIEILTEKGSRVFDVRPLVRLTVSVVTEKDGKMESGFYSGGGRYGYEKIVNEETKKLFVDEAVQMAIVKLDAQKAPV